MSDTTTPEALTQRVFRYCVGCGHCRDLLPGSSCLFFPRLFRLHDREQAGKGKITSREMKQLLDLCNTCAICPCRHVRTWIREAKDAFVARDGLPAYVRVLQDVRLLSKTCGKVPRLTNALLEKGPQARLIKRVFSIHPERKLPRFPASGFDEWARQKGLDRQVETSGRKVAYFTGCSARYLFPDVAKATVEVLEANNVAVHVPEQRCCGMPSMLEGDRAFTFKSAAFNVREMLPLIEAGYDVVTACPSCGYMLKLLQEGAEYSESYQNLVREAAEQTGGDLVAASERLEQMEPLLSQRSSDRGGPSAQWWRFKFALKGLLRDQGYFASFDGLARMKVARHTFDLGEYLLALHKAGEFNDRLGPVPSRMAYYRPCHQREQAIGEPWTELLKLVPQMSLDTVGDSFDCCGSAGTMGFRKSFHGTSMAIGAKLAGKIRAAAPESVLTDCLSCRIQFNQMLPHEVSHPVEILRAAYLAAGSISSTAKEEKTVS